jgi:hypothetical protein
LKQLLTFFAFAGVFNTWAQTVLPLTKLNFSAGVVVPVYNNHPFNTYQNHTGVKIELGANLLKGEVMLNAASFNNTNADLTEYRSVLISVGYAINIPLIKNVWIKPYLGFGAHHMMFEQNSANTNNLRESELMYQAGLAIQTKLYKKIHFQAGTIYSGTQTFHKQHQLFLQSGLMYYFNTPKKLQYLIN